MAQSSGGFPHPGRFSMGTRHRIIRESDDDRNSPSYHGLGAV